MIYVTGDTHGAIDISKLNTKNWPLQKQLKKSDYVIIAGDFGCIWSGDKEDNYWLNWLEKKPFTTLFVDGNHENFTLLNQYPVMEWNGGKVHQIRPTVLHLTRGQVFTIEGKTIFTVGGAASIDKEFRKEGKSWWAEEIPSEAEYEEAMVNLKRHDMKVDFVVSHTAPSIIIDRLKLAAIPAKLNDPTCKMLNEIMHSIIFKRWYFGHFHADRQMGGFVALYNHIHNMQEGIIPNDTEPRDWKIEKYISKFRASLQQGEKIPSYQKVGELIDKWDREGRHITYPLAGPSWDQIAWQQEYDALQNEFENIINHQAGPETYVACANGDNCSKSDDCKCWKLYRYMVDNEIFGETCVLYEPQDCKEFREMSYWLRPKKCDQSVRD